MRGLAAAAALATMIAPAYAGSSSDAAKPVAVAARLSQDASGARLIFDISQPVEARAYALSSPDRIVVDLPEVAFQLDPSVGRIAAVNDDALVKAFRFGPLTAGRSRIIIDLARPACPAEVLAKPIVDGAPASRLLIELKPCDSSAFVALQQAPTAHGCRKPRRSAIRLAAGYRSRPRDTAARMAARMASAASGKRRWSSSFASNSNGNSRRPTSTRSR